MANAAEQIDKGKLRALIRPSEKKYVKSLHKRRKRREGKRLKDLNPKHNRYGGWVV